MNISQKTLIRTNEEGLLCCQFMVQVDSHTCYLEYFVRNILLCGFVYLKFVRFKIIRIQKKTIKTILFVLKCSENQNNFTNIGIHAV